MTAAKVIGLALALLLGATHAEAQHKPIGVFGAECAAPEWTAFGSLAEWDDLHAAAACSRATGRRWVLQLHGSDTGDLEAHTRDLRHRAAKAGVEPYVLAVTLQEEWYERFRHGLLRSHAVFGSFNPATHEVAGVNAIHAWLGVQHAAIHRGWPGVNVAWITTYVNDEPAYGPHLWAPIPAGVDALVLDPYATETQTFEDWPERVFAHAVAITTLPIVLVPQWFVAPGTTFGTARVDMLPGYARWIAHPRVIAAWGFVWASRQGVVGFADLPVFRAAIEQALGVR